MCFLKSSQSSSEPTCSSCVHFVTQFIKICLTENFCCHRGKSSYCVSKLIKCVTGTCSHPVVCIRHAATKGNSTHLSVGRLIDYAVVFAPSRHCVGRLRTRGEKIKRYRLASWIDLRLTEQMPVCRWSSKCYQKRPPAETKLFLFSLFFLDLCWTVKSWRKAQQMAGTL